MEMGVPRQCTGDGEEGKGGFNWEGLETPKDGLVEAEMLNSEAEALLCTKLHAAASVLHSNLRWGSLQWVSVPARSLFPL